MNGIRILGSWWRRYFGPGRKHDGPLDEAENIAAGPHDYRVYFDTLCPICRHSRAMLQQLDWGGRLLFRDIHDREFMERELPGVSYAQALQEMIVATPGWDACTRGSRLGARDSGIREFTNNLRWSLLGPKVLGGFKALRRIAWALPALWLVVPLLYFPLVPSIATLVYRTIARNRYRLNLCNGGTCDLHLRALADSNLDEAKITKIVAQIRSAKQADT
jgi:predicted DCC family thiol-disulfide oxidoreductase YuxK